MMVLKTTSLDPCRLAAILKQKRDLYLPKFINNVRQFVLAAKGISKS